MIVSEKIKVRGMDYVRTYSDCGRLIKKIGTEEIYCEAIDPAELEREYTETDLTEEPM